MYSVRGFENCSSPVLGCLYRLSTTLSFSAVAVMMFATCCWAQTNRGGISGTVFDSKGAVVSGASVNITNVGTNQSIKLTTSGTGSYAASNLEPVTYRIEVEAPGFAKALVEEVKVDTATVVSRNVTLRPGSITTEITVQEQTPLLNVESGTTSQTITERQMQDLPLVNRSVLDLALTAPNVNGVAGSEDPGVTSGVPAPGFNLSLNGGRPGSTIMLADGVNNTGVGIARAVVSFSPETVQEFTVQTSAYSAEYGSTGGGVINVTTKSGTNRLNGTALWYLRNPATSAKPWTAGSQHPPNNLRYNQFSFTVGGPVVLPKIYNGRDKTFFFFAAEPRYRRDFLVVNTLLPDAAMRGGNFSNIVRTTSGWLPASVATQFGLSSVGPSTIYQQFNLVNGQWKPAPTPAPGQTTLPVFPGNVIPQSMLDPTALKALQFMPPAGSYFLDPNGNVKNYVVNRFVKQDEIRYTGRVDHAIGAKDKMNVRYTYVPAVGTKGFGSDINGNGASYSHSQQAVIGETHLFSSTLLNDIRLNYSRGTFSDDYSPAFSVNGGRNLATELGLPSLTHGGMPLFLLNSDGNGYDAFTNIGSAGSTNNYNVEERYNIVDIVNLSRGAMNWKFGVDLTHSLLNVLPFFGASGGRWDFRTAQTSAVFGSSSIANGGNPFASYLLGIPNSILQRPVLIPYYYRWNSVAAFVQNDWKVRPSLTLNLGLRYSLQLPRTEKNNLQGEFLPQLAQGFPLSKPITLPGSNQVVSSILVPPFGYAGRGGRSQYLVPIERYDFEPRFGFAWNPHLFGLDSLVVRGGYGLSHAPITGNNRLPNPDFGGTNTISTTSTGSSGGVDPFSALRLSSNAPLINQSLTPAQALNIPSDGLVYLGSLAIPGFAVSHNSHIPYVQNWNLSVSYELTRNMVVEAAYVGAKGTHLYLPLVNINPRDFNLLQAMEVAIVPGSQFTGTPSNAQNTPVSPDTSITDPLGRKDLLGNTISIPLGSLASQYGGFNALSSYFNGGGDSIRHAAYISLLRRVANGLLVTANYTYGRSIDDASDASPDKNVLATGVTQGGQVTFGAPLAGDRAESVFDIPHAFSATYIYDLPFGSRRHFLQNSWAPIRWAIGNWTTSGVFRLQSEYPFLPVIADTNGLSGSLTHTVRPDIVPGVPLVNPKYNRNCVTVNTCEPFLNPAAFMRPVKGKLGNASRTLAIRGPMQRFFDASIQKDFPLPGAEGRRRIQFRVDLLNAFNHPNFQVTSGTLVNGGSSNDFMGAPNEGTITATPSGNPANPYTKTFAPITSSEYDSWATLNNQPLSATTAGGAQLKAIQTMVNSTRLASGALPTDFFHVPVPQGFATANANSFDIRTLDGFKLYRLRQAYGLGFGQLRELGQPRYIQFGLKIYF